MRQLEERYLERLSQLYPTIAKASTEIINLQAILNLPKGTEHFLTDIHGEYEAFAHVLKNGSGSVRRKIDDVFGNTMSSRDKQTLATLIYYPKEKMDRIKKTEKNMEDWYKITLYRLIEVCKRTASKYTRSKVRKALPPDFAYVIEELNTEKNDMTDKESYYNAIVSTIIRIGRAEKFIIAMSELIQRLTVDHLHIVGDIYDRGPGPHIIIDELMNEWDEIEKDACSHNWKEGEILLQPTCTTTGKKQMVCENCGKKISPLGYTCRDHCNYCLHSKHVDINPGDRAENCNGVLEPIGLEINSKKGYVIVFKCKKCGAIRKNKAAKDDNMDLIIGLSSKNPCIK